MIHVDIPIYPKPPRTWRNKFREARSGILQALKKDSKSFGGHFLATFLAVSALIALGCDRIEWAIVVLTIGWLWVTELINSAIEAVFHGLDAETRAKWNPCLDIAAGAVLTASFFAVLIAVLIFGGRLAQSL